MDLYLDSFLEGVGGEGLAVKIGTRASEKQRSFTQPDGSYADIDEILSQYNDDSYTSDAEHTSPASPPDTNNEGINAALATLGEQGDQGTAAQTRAETSSSTVPHTQTSDAPTNLQIPALLQYLGDWTLMDDRGLLAQESRKSTPVRNEEDSKRNDSSENVQATLTPEEDSPEKEEPTEDEPTAIETPPEIPSTVAIVAAYRGLVKEQWSQTYLNELECFPNPYNRCNEWDNETLDLRDFFDDDGIDNYARFPLPPDQNLLRPQTDKQSALRLLQHWEIRFRNQDCIGGL